MAARKTAAGSTSPPKTQANTKKAGAKRAASRDKPVKPKVEPNADLVARTADELRSLSFDELWDLLPAKYQRFMGRYAELKFTNASRAYEETIYVGAGDGTINVDGINTSAHRLLKHPLIAAVLAHVGEVSKMSVLSAMTHLSEIAASSIVDFCDVVVVKDQAGEIMYDDEGYERKEIRINVARAIEEGKAYAIAGIKYGANGIEVKLDDRQRAIAKILEVSGATGPARGTAGDPIHTLPLTLEQYRAQSQARVSSVESDLDDFETHVAQD